MISLEGRPNSLVGNRLNLCVGHDAHDGSRFFLQEHCSRHYTGYQKDKHKFRDDDAEALHVPTKLCWQKIKITMQFCASQKF